VGQLGDAVDLLGADVKVQAKHTKRRAPAALERAVAGAGWASLDILPAYVSGPLERMDGLYPDRIPVVVWSYGGHRPTRDFFYVRARQMYALHGWPEGYTLPGWLVMTGEYWLENHGREGYNPPDRMVSLELAPENPGAE
jgi:hypothetical protein